MVLVVAKRSKFISFTFLMIQNFHLFKQEMTIMQYALLINSKEKIYYMVDNPSSTS